MRLIIASNNAHKVREIKEILGDYFSEILSLKEAGIAIDVEEDGETFEQNALKKAQEVLKIADADAALSDDSGLMVDALDGAPGVYSARFAGEGHDDAANNAKLMDMMRLVPEEKAHGALRERGCVGTARQGTDGLPRRGGGQHTLRSAGGERLRIRPAVLLCSRGAFLCADERGGQKRHKSPQKGAGGAQGRA